MGIIKQRDSGDHCESGSSQRVLLIESYQEEAPISSDIPESLSMVNTTSPSRKRPTAPAKKWFEEFRKWENARNIKRGTGTRQSRRLENLNFLLNMTEKEDSGEIDFVDIVEPQFSAFAGLFKEQEKMRIWNDFINRSEDDQEQWLSSGKPNNSGYSPVDDSDLEDDVEVVEHDESWEELDERNIHPAFSAEQCFKRIDQNLKALLKKRHFPLGALSWLEKEITAFFIEWPNSVYISKLPSSFDRMMLHALCQYMDLRSHSFDDTNGQRQTQVENHHEEFLPPDVSLSQFIEAKSKKY